jgi:hypothetical protein
VYKLCFYVPEAQVEQVKQAVFAAGAGRIGGYDNCSWQALGEGQFRPLPGSEPFIGTEGDLARVQEYRVEMVCSDECVAAVVTALRAAHPYQQPAWSLIKLESEFDGALP